MDGRPVLRDPVEDSRLQRSGFVVMPLLDADEVYHLLTAYESIVPGNETGLQLDFVRPDRDLVRRLVVELRSMLEPKVDAVFVDHWPVLTSFIVKHPGPGSDFYLHRDITMNDGRTNRCFTAWIPLVDVGPDRANGGLSLVPGSERLPTGEHGFDASVLIEPFQDFLVDHLQTVGLGAGDAVVYDARLLHASAANASPMPRLAVGCGIGRRSEPLVYARPTGRRHRVVHEIDRDFFVDHHPADVVMGGMPPRYPVVDEFDDLTRLSGEDVRRILGADRLPAERTSVPEDLAAETDDQGLPFRHFPRGVERLSPATADIPVAAADLAPLASTIATAAVLSSTGSCGANVIVRRGRRVDDAPDWLRAVVGRVGSIRTRDVVLLALDPGARVTLAIKRRRFVPLTLTVLECPQVRSGVRTSTHASALDLGLRFALDLDEPVTIWNDGPGPTLVLLRRQVRLSADRDHGLGRPIG